MQTTVTPERLFELIVEAVGAPVSRTKYVWRWNLRADMDVVMERRGRVAKIWLPWGGTDLGFGVRRTPSERVNSNVYHKAASLAPADLLELKIRSEDELIAALTHLCSIVGLPAQNVVC